MNEATKKLVEEAEMKVGAASPRPWAIRPSVDRWDDSCADVISKGNGNLTVCSEVDSAFDPERGSFADADFIAFSREAVPALCAEVRRLDEERTKERTAWSEFADAQFAHGLATAELRRSEHPILVKKANETHATLIRKAETLASFGVDMSEILGDP